MHILSSVCAVCFMRTHRENCNSALIQTPGSESGQREASGESSHENQHPVLRSLSQPAVRNTSSMGVERGESSTAHQPVTRSLSQPADRNTSSMGVERGESSTAHQPVTRLLSQPMDQERRGFARTSGFSQGNQRPVTRSSTQPLDRDTEVQGEEGGGSLQNNRSQTEDEGIQRQEEPVIDLTQLQTSDNGL
ncbi:hypothetical protein DPEC_G00188590 [Dallia pectoralis]|uniref:Uncharacterized protein n=1 Tax=Dallia pectoralis TaxID=75939 RepID=A0ACC2GBZ6_DALPE|nr:hypothetical protein DPEC_G00188590 [Dallia pectoralis]